MANHSATHILHWALREVLGDHVKQRGSLVEPGRLRFDFTHFSSISDEELAKVEEMVNEKIRSNQRVNVKILSMDEAVEEGAIALFDEKYGDTVRMVEMGDFSKELCGGTHTSQTGDIGYFKIVSEGGIASGVRRIEALTGGAAVSHVKGLEDEVREIGRVLRGSQGELVSKLDRLLEEKKELEREIEKLKANLAGGGSSDILDGLMEVDGIKVLSKEVDHISNPKDLRQYGDRVREKLSSGIALLGARDGGKAFLLAIVTKDLSKKFKAGALIKMAAEKVGGSGGGRPDMAQAGGSKPECLPEALASATEYIKQASGN
jgi:alanyl-tRNA synthetase